MCSLYECFFFTLLWTRVSFCSDLQWPHHDKVKAQSLVCMFGSFRVMSSEIILAHNWREQVGAPVRLLVHVFQKFTSAPTTTSHPWSNQQCPHDMIPPRLQVYNSTGESSRRNRSPKSTLLPGPRQLGYSPAYQIDDSTGESSRCNRSPMSTLRSPMSTLLPGPRQLGYLPAYQVVLAFDSFFHCLVILQ